MGYNPVFRTVVIPQTPLKSTSEPLTVNGTICRAGFLLSCAGASGLWLWTEARRNPYSTLLLVALPCAILAPLLVWATVREKRRAALTAPLYALAEGAVLGTLAGGLDARYPGIAFEAISLTFTISVFMLILYRSGLVLATRRFNNSVVAATGGVALFYLVDLALRVMGLRPFAVFAGGVPGVLFSVVVVALAALNLVSDFDLIVQCEKAELPKYMEWYTALGLIVTLVWLYVEILKLLSKAKSAEQQPTSPTQAT